MMEQFYFDSDVFTYGSSEEEEEDTNDKRVAKGTYIHCPLATIHNALVDFSAIAESDEAAVEQVHCISPPGHSHSQCLAGHSSTRQKSGGRVSRATPQNWVEPILLICPLVNFTHTHILGLLLR